jgi:alpha 1,3-glucosidase
MIQNLTAKGHKLVVIIDPHIKRETGYFLHDEATSMGYYVKNKDGNDYEGIYSFLFNKIFIIIIYLLLNN